MHGTVIGVVVGDGVGGDGVGKGGEENGDIKKLLLTVGCVVLPDSSFFLIISWDVE